MADRGYRPFSWRWVVLSIVAFIGAELAIGGLVGELVLGRMVSINTSFLLQGLLNLSGFVVGGFIIGVVSPGRRIVEAAAAGAATMALISVMAVFVPFRYIGYSQGSFVLAALLAAAIGAAGAYGGERITGNVGKLGSR